MGEFGADVVLDDAPVLRGGRRRRWPWLVALGMAFLLFASAGAVAGGTVSYASAYDGRFLPGTVVAGVDVGGLTRGEAVPLVRKALRPTLARKVTVSWGKRSWTATARELGARNNARRVLDAVAAEQVGVTWQEWARLRWLGETVDDSAEVAVRYPRKGIRRFANSIEEEIEREPRDATLEVTEDGVEVTPGRIGRRFSVRRLTKRLQAALVGGHREVALDVKEREPDVTADAFDQVLLLDQGDHELTLYLDGEAHKTWVVATGTGEYPTPLGRYEVTLKRYLPTWVNPDPDGWGSNMPEVIPPGPNNPLGLRALNWSAPGAIRFHGTQAVDTLGTDASHGCVRMSNADVIELYDLVDEGAVIISQA